VNPADFNELANSDKKHFYRCKQCGEMVDLPQLDDILFQADHKSGQTFSTADHNALNPTNEGKARL